MHDPRITVMYRPQIVAPAQRGYSRSPQKPALWMRHVQSTPLADALQVDSDFDAITESDLALAHTPDYVDAFMRGSPRALARSSDNGWSEAYRDSVLAKVGALVAAGQRAVARPQRIVLSPTSGDHHARPDRGAGFCPIAGQVIAALKLLRGDGIRTAWIDLDEHYGNAIPEGAAHRSEVREAIPIDINPQGRGTDYLASLDEGLARVERALLAGAVELVCVGHGADSHEWDDLGGSVTTEQWIEAGRRAYAMVKRASARLGRAVPLVCSFFGGYRQDDYRSVLELHVADVATALDVLAGTEIGFSPRVQRPNRHFDRAQSG